VHAIIAGCGRVGGLLAQTLLGEGHEVVIIDKDENAFRRLGNDFKGTTLRGLAFDKGTLEAAKIRQAGAFVAVTNGDNSNIVSARTAHERYGVERVVARIYDPTRAEIFERMGVSIIASARWTTDAVMARLATSEERIETVVGTGAGDVVLVTLRAPDAAHGVRSDQVQRRGHSVLAALTRAGNTVLPTPTSLIEAGDLLHLVVYRRMLDEVRVEIAQLGQEEA
jgi:trk system potassium uptake protein TrkA